MKKKKSSIFKQENIPFCVFGQVVQLPGYAFCGFVPLNGLGVGWGRGGNPWGHFFFQKIKIGSFDCKFPETFSCQISKKSIFMSKLAKKFCSPGSDKV